MNPYESYSKQSAYCMIRTDSLCVQKVQQQIRRSCWHTSSMMYLICKQYRYVNY